MACSAVGHGRGRFILGSGCSASLTPSATPLLPPRLWKGNAGMPRRKRPSEIVAPAVYASLLDSQQGGCGVCGKPGGTRALAIDHDHATGEVRGLLCHA